MPTTLPASTGEELSNERKSQIKSFKEMFPLYRSCTNDDVLAIFAEFPSYEAAVYGAANNLVVYKPTMSWESVEKPSKKKKKNQNHGARSASTNPRGRNTDGPRTDRRDERRDERRDNRDNRSERGRSSTRGQANTGRGASSSRPDDRRKAPQDVVPPPTRSEVQKAPTQNAPAPVVEKKQAAPTQQSQKPSAVSGAPAWGPAAAASRAKAAAAAAASSTSTVQHPSSASSSSSAQQSAASSYANAAKSRQPWNPAAGKAPAAAPVAQQKPVVAAPQKPVEQQQPVAARQEQAPRKAAPVKEVKPRVGVLLPGGFASEDMSFQFGNLGLGNTFGELTSAPEPTAASPSLAPSPSQPSDSKPAAAPTDEGPAVPPGFSPYSGMPPMAYMPQFAEGEAGMRPPMMNMYYPEPARGGDAAGRGSANAPTAGAAGYSSGGRGATGGENKFPEGAGGPQATNAPYPGYYAAMPYGFPNQAYPGNSYGNQFYPFRPNYYQGFGMPYGSHEEEYKARGMNPYGYAPGAAPESGAPAGDASKAAQGSQPASQEKASSGAENFGEGYGRGGPDAHYYAQEMYSGFGQQYYPGHMMGQQHYQQPQQQQQQQGGSAQQQQQQGQQPGGSRGY